MASSMWHVATSRAAACRLSLLGRQSFRAGRLSHYTLTETHTLAHTLRDTHIHVNSLSEPNKKKTHIHLTAQNVCARHKYVNAAMNIASALLWLHVARLILHTYGASVGCMRIFKTPAVICAAAGPRLIVLGVMTCPSTATVQSFVSNGKNASMQSSWRRTQTSQRRVSFAFWVA